MTPEQAAEFHRVVTSALWCTEQLPESDREPAFRRYIAAMEAAQEQEQER